MRTQPRQEILDIWKAVAKASWNRQEKRWKWGGRFAENSIGDAEQLLCILLPATQLTMFGLDNPNLIGTDMARSLDPLAEKIDIPVRLIEVLVGYYKKYTNGAGRPMFAGGAYFSTDDGSPPTEKQQAIDVVDSFAMSITLSLATIGFLRVFRKSTGNDGILAQLDQLEGMAGTRLTAAMVGLLRSFSTNVFAVDSETGRYLLRMINQSGRKTRDVVPDFQRRLRQTTASFREVLIGSGQADDDEMARDDRLWECGWSWGIVDGAPPVTIVESVAIGVDPGVAEKAPYLYFTAVAMDAIEDLFSERTRVLGLLDEGQQRLARALQLRSDLTRSYWATVATFDDNPQWPVEDIPWRTTDSQESDYYTLQVASLAVKGLLARRGSDAEFVRIGEVMRELANRARITRRPSASDSGISLHSPGLRVELVGSESMGAARLTWYVNEFAPLLMQRLVTVAGLMNDSAERSNLLEIADRVWEHLKKRRIEAASGEGVWDRPSGAFPNMGFEDLPPSWYFTERVVQALVVAARTLDRPPLQSDRMIEVASDMISEAEHVFDHLLLTDASSRVLSADIKAIRATLARAREAQKTQPGTAAALASNALIKLNELAVSGRAGTEVI